MIIEVTILPADAKKVQLSLEQVKSGHHLVSQEHLINNQKEHGQKSMLFLLAIILIMNYYLLPCILKDEREQEG